MQEETTVESTDIETTDTEVVDDTVELTEDATGASTTETVDKDATIAKLSADNKKLFARLKRQESKDGGASSATQKTETATEKTETPTGLTRDEAILFAKGFDEAEVEHAQKVATLQGVKLTDAVKDPLFTTWKSNKEAEAKRVQAQLGTSKGARTTVKKTLDTPGLSDEDHKAMFQELIG